MIPEVIIDQALFRYRSSASSLNTQRCGVPSRPLLVRLFSLAFPIASKKAAHAQVAMMTTAGSATIQKIKFNKSPNPISFIWKKSPPSRLWSRFPFYLGENCIAIDARFSINCNRENRARQEEKDARDGRRIGAPRPSGTTSKSSSGISPGSISMRSKKRRSTISSSPAGTLRRSGGTRSGRAIRSTGR